MSFISVVQQLSGGLNQLVEKIGTLKVLRAERAKRAKKLKKQIREEEEGAPLQPPAVIEKMPAPVKEKEVLKQEVFEFMEASKAFQLPSTSLLEAEVEKRPRIDRDSLIMNSRILEKKL
jgi:hypothetical protein